MHGELGYGLAVRLHHAGLDHPQGVVDVVSSYRMLSCEGGVDVLRGTATAGYSTAPHSPQL